MQTRTFGTALISTLTLLSVGWSALAQQQPTPPFKGAAIPQPRQKPQSPQGDKRERSPGDFYSALPLDVLQMYLKLDKEQSTKIEPLLKKVKTEQTKLLAMGGDATPDPTKIQTQFQLLADTVKQGEKDIEAALTEEQKKKAEMMFDDVRRFGSIGIPREAIGEAKLTDKQKKDLLALADEYQKKRGEIKPEDSQIERPKLGKDYRAKALTLLTDEQKQTVEKARANNAIARKPKSP